MKIAIYSDLHLEFQHGWILPPALETDRLFLLATSCCLMILVIMHHAPGANAGSQYLESPLQPAFVASDVLPLIEKYEPLFWFYGHTHEGDNQTIGKTKIISNKLGCPQKNGNYECSRSFDPQGCSVVIA